MVYSTGGFGSSRKQLKLQYVSYCNLVVMVLPLLPMNSQPINGVSSKQSEAFRCILMYLIIKPIRNTERAAALMNFIRHFKRDCHRRAFF